MSAVARFRYTLVAGATAVVIGSGFTVVGLSRQADAQDATPTAADAPLAVEPTTEDPVPSTAPSSVPGSPRPSGTASPTPRHTATVKPRPRPKATTTRVRTTSTVEAASTDDSVIGQVLSHINAARADAGLSALTLDTKLSKASAQHNQLMIDGCGLDHQCPGESGLGDRFSAQGVQWRSAGENIGYSSSGSSDAAMVKAANGLTDGMLAEKAPDDGHRKNLLNSGFKRIGLSVVRDRKGITWMTQDFVN